MADYTTNYNIPYIHTNEGSPEIKFKSAMDIIDSTMASISGGGGGATGTPVILTGVAGGQNIRGGTGAGDSLQLQSTSHSTKGLITLGSQSQFNDATDCLGIYQNSPVARVHIGPGTASVPGIKMDVSTLTSVPAEGFLEYDHRFHVTESDAVRRFLVQAISSNEVTAGAPFTNIGYVPMVINGTTRNVMICA